MAEQTTDSSERESVRLSRAEWFHFLSEEDWAFVKRFVLASGSLKAVAQEYGISYPTVRLRLDRLIQKIRMVDEHQQASRFERLLRAQFADGKVDAETLKTLLRAYHEERGGRDANTDHQ